MTRKIAVFVLIVALALPFVLVSKASADDGDMCSMWDSGYDYGQHHAEMAQMGMLGQDHNPGTHHQGYSNCVP